MTGDRGQQPQADERRTLPRSYPALHDIPPPDGIARQRFLRCFPQDTVLHSARRGRLRRKLLAFLEASTHYDAGKLLVRYRSALQ